MATPIGDLVVMLGANTSAYERGLARAMVLTKQFVSETQAAGKMGLAYFGSGVEKAFARVNTSAALKGGLASFLKTSSVEQFAEKIGQAIPPVVTLRGKLLELGKVGTKALGNIASKAVLIGQNIVSATIATAALGAGVAVLSMGRAFEVEFLKATAIMDDLTDSMKRKMKDTAFSIAAEFGFSAAQIARGYRSMAEAGFSAQEAMTGMRPMVAFAKAGFMELDAAIRFLGRSLTAMELPLSMMPELGDALTAANIATQASVESLASGLSNKLAGALRNAGFGLREGTALLAAFAQKGVIGEEAGMAASMVIRDLGKAALASKYRFKDFHDAVFSSYGTFKGMASTVRFLEEKLSKLPPEGRDELLEAYGFQWKSLHHVLTLLGSSKMLEKYESQFNQVGLASDIARRMMDGLSRAWSELKASAEKTGNSLLPALGPPLEAILRLTAGILSNLQAIPMAWERITGLGGKTWGIKQAIENIEKMPIELAKKYHPEWLNPDGTLKPEAERRGKYPSTLGLGATSEQLERMENQIRMEQHLRRQKELEERILDIRRESSRVQEESLSHVQRYMEKAKALREGIETGALEDLAEANEMLSQLGGAIREETIREFETPAEQVERRLKDLLERWRAGFIGENEFRKGEAAILRGAGGKTLTSAIEWGSAEAWSAIFRSMGLQSATQVTQGDRLINTSVQDVKTAIMNLGRPATFSIP